MFTGKMEDILLSCVVCLNQAMQCFFLIKMRLAGSFVMTVHPFKGQENSQKHFSLPLTTSYDSPAAGIEPKMCRVEYRPSIHPQSLRHTVVVQNVCTRVMCTYSLYLYYVTFVSDQLMYET